MNSLIDWFWEGITLQHVTDKKMVKRMLILYSLVCLQITGIAVVCLVSFWCYKQLGITHTSFGSLFLPGMMVFGGFFIFISVFITAIRHYRRL